MTSEWNNSGDDSEHEKQGEWWRQDEDEPKLGQSLWQRVRWQNVAKAALVAVGLALLLSNTVLNKNQKPELSSQVGTSISDSADESRDVAQPTKRERGRAGKERHPTKKAPQRKKRHHHRQHKQAPPSDPHPYSPPPPQPPPSKTAGSTEFLPK